jgi:DNA-binding MarR family transcriptional regulator
VTLVIIKSGMVGDRVKHKPSKRTARKVVAAAGKENLPSARPLLALLSQILVAYTVELDNAFEHRMGLAGYPGALLSLVMWSNLMRFLVDGEISVRDLAAQALAPDEDIKLELGCLERWGFVMLQPDVGDERPISRRVHRLKGRLLRDGWGSGRGIRSGWRVCLTEKGQKAAEIWRSLVPEIEDRWSARFGHNQLDGLRKALAAVAAQFDLQLPGGVPLQWNATPSYPKASGPRTIPELLPVLLSQLLLVLTIEFNSDSRCPLWLCANTLRVLEPAPVRLSDIVRLSGASRASGDIGWQVRPFVIVETDQGTKRGKVARLSPLGLEAMESYRARVRQIENRCQERFGREVFQAIRSGLLNLFEARRDDRLLLSDGLIPAEGTMRAGAQAPALGRRDVGPAARQRMRDLVAQTELFVMDPAVALPHYPMWDMNRGFGP